MKDKKPGPKPLIPLQQFNKNICIDPKTNCWNWLGSIWNGGFPLLRINRKPTSAHVWAYKTFVGPLIGRNPVTQKCKNKLCVNPQHLIHKQIADRFWEKVNKNGPIINKNLGPCWLWTAFKDGDGYGRFQISSKSTAASRISWELTYGKITNSKTVIMHKCDHPPCVNPTHLSIGTVRDNNRDRALKQRSRNQSGQRNNMAVLDEKSVSIIRDLSKNTTLSHSQIAEIFQVSRPTVSLILKNKRWNEKHSSLKGELNGPSQTP